MDITKENVQMLHMFNFFKVGAAVSVPFMANLPAVHISSLLIVNSLTRSNWFPRALWCTF